MDSVLVHATDEFIVEVGSEYIQHDLVPKSPNAVVDLRVEEQSTEFDYSLVKDPDDVCNIVGQLHSTFLEEPFIITVLRTPVQGKLRGLIRTKTGDHKFFIPAALFKSNTPSPKKILKILKEELPQLTTAKLCIVTDPKLQEELRRIEELKHKSSRCFKIGVLYAKAGQTTEEEMFGNEVGSAGFEEFLKLLGEEVPLAGFQGFRGDLDVTENHTTGLKSVYTRLRDFEIMFHVSTMLPFSSIDSQQIMRKRFIGNDLSCIVYLESGGSFTAPTISGDFLHIFAVVQPVVHEGVPGYRLGIASKVGVPPFGPPLPKPSFFPTHNQEARDYFRNFLLTKVMNGERASVRSPFIASKMRKSRRQHLQLLVQQFCTTESKSN